MNRECKECGDQLPSHYKDYICKTCKNKKDRYIQQLESLDFMDMDGT